MIYHIFRPFTRLACLIYFRKIFFLHAERVPRKGPLLIVCNHPSAFFEACLLAVLLPRSLYFLTRGDFFKNRMFSWLLRQTHQIPIFRADDGFDKLRNNQGTFAYCYQALKEQKAIIIFPEALTVVEKRLRPVQKGAARLAIGALKLIPSLNILPIGVTFSDPTRFRSLVTIKCGNMIPVPAMDPAADERTMIAQLTVRIEAAMKELIVQIDDPAREPIFDSMQELAFNSKRIASFPIVSSADEFPVEEDRLADKINAITEEMEKTITTRISAYHTALRKLGLNDRFFLFMKRLPQFLRILLIPGIVLFLIGKMIFLLPTWFVIRFVDAKIPRPAFYGPVKWAMGFFLLGIWSLIFLLLGYMLGGTWGLILVVAWIMLGYTVLVYMHNIRLRGLLKSFVMSRREREALEALRNNTIQFM